MFIHKVYQCKITILSCSVLSVYSIVASHQDVQYSILSLFVCSNSLSNVFGALE